MKVVPILMLTSRRAAWGLIATAVFVIVAFGVPAAVAGGHGMATHAPVGAPAAHTASPAALAHVVPHAAYFVNVTITNNYTGPVDPAGHDQLLADRDRCPGSPGTTSASPTA